MLASNHSVISRAGEIKFIFEMSRAGWALRTNISEKKWKKAKLGRHLLKYFKNCQVGEEINLFLMAPEGGA